MVATNVTAGHVKAGVTIAGVLGTYPSSSTPLAASTATTDLTTYATQISTTGTFEFFDSAGNHYIGSGDSNLDAPNIKHGTSVLGVNGSFAPDCNGDGLTNCRTVGVYKFVDTSALRVWDIRAGKSAGGIIGSLAFYNNFARLSVYNRISGGGSDVSTTVPDFYDTLEDYTSTRNGNHPGPPGERIAGLNWLRDSASDSDNDTTCNGAQECVYTDRITGRMWKPVNTPLMTWEAAIAHCRALTYGTYTGWHLPTQKEMLMAGVNGIFNVAAIGFSSAGSQWTSTTSVANTNNAWAIYLGSSDQFTEPKVNATYQALCIR